MNESKTIFLFVCVVVAGLGNMRALGFIKKKKQLFRCLPFIKTVQVKRTRERREEGLKSQQKVNHINNNKEKDNCAMLCSIDFFFFFGKDVLLNRWERYRRSTEQQFL